MTVVRAAALAALVALFFPLAASAHPLGNFTINRYSRIELAPESVSLRYVLDLAEIPTLQELAAVGATERLNEAQRDAILGRFAALVRDGARLAVGGQAVALARRDAALELVPGEAGLFTMRVALTLAADVRVADGAALGYEDTTLADRVGWREVVLRPGPGVRLEGSTVPSEDQTDELRRYPADPARPPLAVSAASATVRIAPGEGVDPARAGAAAARRAADAPRLAADGLARSVGDLVRTSSTGDAVSILLALFAAAALGGFHALTPGHGKTVIAAYLVGTRGTARQALGLGAAVAASHTLGVLVLALVILGASSALAPERFYPYLSAVSAAIVLGIGGWLLRGALRERSGSREQGHTHAHGGDRHGGDRQGGDRQGGGRHGSGRHSGDEDIPPHGHGHDHGGSHRHAHANATAAGWRSLVALGVSGGIVPSASALLLLLAALSLRRPDLGLALIVAFGAGMAAVLVAIGLALVRARRLAARHLADRAIVRRVAGLLPLGTAVVVLLVGTGLIVQAGQQLFASL